MIAILEPVLLLLVLSTPSCLVLCDCFDVLTGRRYPEKSVWVRSEFFNVTCENGRMKVLNCISDFGTRIPLQTDSFWENSIEYSCIDDESGERGLDGNEASGEEPTSEGCSGDRTEFFANHFVISCITKE
ncbi:unnamed protein product [Anisakis simplex]|uniref:Secreted protein n=1 Tax=Anisakis simplex TaxID=6269 RepID=A0A0M3J847_ANISI|nr:unnamed protein product [Anisakis simplex]